MSEPYMTKQDVATYTRMSEKWVQRRAADLGGHITRWPPQV